MFVCGKLGGKEAGRSGCLMITFSSSFMDHGVIVRMKLVGSSSRYTHKVYPVLIYCRLISDSLYARYLVAYYYMGAETNSILLHNILYDTLRHQLCNCYHLNGSLLRSCLVYEPGGH